MNFTKSFILKLQFLVWVIFLVVITGTQSVHGQDATGTPEPVPIDVLSANSATVLVFDTSGSMADPDAGGLSKLQAARQAGGNVLNVLAAEIEAELAGTHQVGLVSFDDTSRIHAELTVNISEVQAGLSSLNADRRTGMAAGLQTAVEMVQPLLSAGEKPIIILLSDGLPNVTLNGSLNENQAQREVLSLAAQANSSGICLYTVGFGIPGDDSMDEAFLKRVAQESNCGGYYRADDASQLANIYIELRHRSTGEVLLQHEGSISQGQNVDLGVVEVPVGQAALLLTLNWTNGDLTALLKDPNGRIVDQDYPQATFTNQENITNLIIKDPIPGAWGVSVSGDQVSGNTANYHLVFSTRKMIEPPSTMLPFWLLLGALFIFVGGVWVHYQQGSGWILTVTERDNVTHYKIGRSGVWVGRSSQCRAHVQSDQSVSAWHCWVGPGQAKHKLNIQDNGSQFGTKCNGHPITHAAINEKDHIQIGSDTTLRVYPQQ